jgi:hypothetical protein
VSIGIRYWPLILRHLYTCSHWTLSVELLDRTAATNDFSPGSTLIWFETFITVLRLSGVTFWSVNWHLLLAEMSFFSPLRRFRLILLLRLRRTVLDVPSPASSCGVGRPRRPPPFVVQQPYPSVLIPMWSETWQKNKKVQSEDACYMKVYNQVHTPDSNALKLNIPS